MPSSRRTGRVTLVEVAERANCSVSLASIVMRGAPGASEQTRRRVRAVAEEIGYRPDQRARALRRSASGLIGVTFGVLQPFHAELVAGLYEAIGASGYEMVLSAVVGPVDDQQAVETLLTDRCEAIIMLAPAMGTRRLRALAQEVPVVVVARPMSVPGVDTVRIDDAGGQRLAVDRLVSAGHRRIVHVDGGRAPSAAERRSGYRAAMTAHGLGSRAAVVAGGLEEEDGARAVHDVLGLTERPTAITAFNDRCAAGMVQELAVRGIGVPDDISVIGFDDSRRARTCPVPLTTIDQDTRLMARLALERAIGRAQQRYLATDQVLVPRLVERDSVAPAPR
ncbi:LacI family DNA-binding transcriptional regulator [Actinomyces slackii]|uniref:Catabolite control protein n=1 Tax=Actinomyces slackii TaxID=52774 RepID=A0A448KCJ5_9ACTO|nr:LacI family DNA-binding transcriptional regulator [Actinomyces slackii]VEG74649.1 Catabolite control protein [Actinomyces slackii]